MPPGWLTAGVAVFMSVWFGTAAAQERDDSVQFSERTEAAEMSATLPRGVFDTPGLAVKLTRDAQRRMNAFAEDSGDAHKEYGGDEHWRSWTLEIKHEVTWQSTRLVSVLRQTWTYTGGAHGNVALDSVVYDRASGRGLALEDFFGSLPDGAPVLKVMADHARQRLNEKLGQFSDTQWIAEGTAPERTTYDAFTLVPSTENGKAGGIAVHFAPYAVAPYAAGPQQVTIPQAVFKDAVKPQWRGVFAGEPVAP